MEVDYSNNNFGDTWAHDCFVALSDHGEKWPVGNPPSFPQDCSLLTHGSVERWGQITPPEYMSPVEPRHSSLDHQQNEALFPEGSLQAQNRQPQHNPPEDAQQNDESERPSKRRRTPRQSQAHQAQSNAPSFQQQDATHPQPPKRKRGRPKRHPTMVEALTADGYPVQVSSARESHLEKNRVAAHKCRQRKKEYINGLEARAREFSATNKALKENVAMLREEVLGLKNEVLRHAGCSFWAVDEYLARCAGDLVGIEAPASVPGSRKSSQTESSAMKTLDPMRLHRDSSADSPSSRDSSDNEDYGMLELFRNMDEKTDGRG